MDYFSIINLSKEPFSNSPDPEYFFQSRQHVDCLQKLELSLRLRRGLNVVIGEVGTGKTTLCRQLIRRFSGDDDCETHLILDPYFGSPSEFLTAVAEMFEGVRPRADANEWQLKEIIKQYIFCKGVDENKTVILIIDEGQKIPDFCLEILREFLNYETNEFKLLQIAIFAQTEFEHTLNLYHNLADRINLYHLLGPLSFRDTRQMIRFRIRQASDSRPPPAMFTYPALWAIYRASGGYPRKIVNICHRSILAMIIQNRTKAGWFLTRSSVKRSLTEPTPKWRRITAGVFIVPAVVALIVVLVPDRLKIPAMFNTETRKTAMYQTEPIHINSPEIKEPAVRMDTRQPDVRPGLPSEPRPEGDRKGNEDSLQAAVLGTVPAGIDQRPGNQQKMPFLLGQVALRRNGTLWHLIEKVYGVFNNKYLKSIKKANPQITNPNRIAAGRPISIPAIPATVKPLPQDVWWVKVGEKNRLDEAIQVLRTYPDEEPPVRLVPYWNLREDIKFVILLREYFEDEETAREQLESLPPAVASEGKILTGWDKDTVFFADPYLVQKK